MIAKQANSTRAKRSNGASPGAVRSRGGSKPTASGGGHKRDFSLEPEEQALLDSLVADAQIAAERARAAAAAVESLAAEMKSMRLQRHKALLAMSTRSAGRTRG